MPKANGLPDSNDVWKTVLVHLPATTLMRFRCVSRFWFILIKSDTFINNHMLKRKRRRSLIIVRRYLPPSQDYDLLSFHDPESSELEEVWPSVSIPFLKDLKHEHEPTYHYLDVQLSGSCNGLICIFCGECIIFSNPILREFKRLPPCPLSCPLGYHYSVHLKGFGNTFTNDFKVVLIKSIKSDGPNDEQHMVAHLYYSRTNSWRQIDGDEVAMLHVVYFSFGSDLFVNGTCHWYVRKPSDMSAVILGFDLNTEVFRHLEYPECLRSLDNDKCSDSVLVLDECLALLAHREMIEEPQLIEVWVMKEYGIKESWTKQFVLGPYFFERPLLCWKNERLVAESDPGELASFALHTNEIKRFALDGADESFWALLYNESLVTVNKAIGLCH